MKKNEPVKISINQEHWPKETLSINAAEREVRLTVFFFLGGWLVLIFIFLNSVKTEWPFVWYLFLPSHFSVYTAL